MGRRASDRSAAALNGGTARVALTSATAHTVHFNEKAITVLLLPRPPGAKNGTSDSLQHARCLYPDGEGNNRGSDRLSDYHRWEQLCFHSLLLANTAAADKSCADPSLDKYPLGRRSSATEQLRTLLGKMLHVSPSSSSSFSFSSSLHCRQSRPSAKICTADSASEKSGDDDDGYSDDEKLRCQKWRFDGGGSALPSPFAASSPFRASPFHSTAASSVASSSASSSPRSSRAGSIHLEFEADGDVELELAVGMAPPELTSAWAAKSHDAAFYLRARTPYPQAVLDAIFAFHAYHVGCVAEADGSSRAGAVAGAPKDARGSPRWEYALDIGCGPGQLAIHLATRFDRVLGQDASERMVALADVAKQLDGHELGRNGLAAVEDPSRIQYRRADGEAPLVPAGVQLDAITLGSCFHWLDTSSRESARAIWTRWSSLLRPGGSLFLIGMRPIIGPFDDGERGRRLKPLRDWLRGFWHLTPCLRPYYDGERIERAYGPHGLFTDTSMPWDLGDYGLARLWDRDAYAYVPIDDPDCGEPVCRDASWIPDNVLRAARRDNSRHELSVSMTTPRRQAEWVRSTSGYVDMLGDNVEQRIRAMTDDDVSAVTVRRICAQIGIGYEDEIECHNAGVVVCLRRSDVICGLNGQTQR